MLVEQRTTLARTRAEKLGHLFYLAKKNGPPVYPAKGDGYSHALYGEAGAGQGYVVQGPYSATRGSGAARPPAARMRARAGTGEIMTRNSLAQQFSGAVFSTRSHKPNGKPVMKPLRHEKITPAELTHMLNDTRLCSYLRRFLETEFSHENLDFYKAVLAYKKNPSIDRCKAIVSTYVRAYAPQQINIDADTREEACQKAKEVEGSGKVDLSLFDSALETIIALLYQQSFPRFVRSEYYDEYLRALGEGSPAELHADTNPDVLLAWTLRNRKDKRAKQFHAFLRGVCAEENLLFWWACEDMFNAKDKHDSVVLPGGQVVTKLHTRAERIFQQYMKEDAPHWVNLDEHHRKSMESDLRTGIIGTGFRAAQDAAFVLMVNDVFLRFLQAENPFPARNDEPERANQHSPEARPLSALRNVPRTRSDRGMSASNLLRQTSNGYHRRRWSLGARSAKRKDGGDAVDMGSSGDIFVGGPGTIRTSTGSIATGIGDANLCAILGPATRSASSDAVRHEMECLSDNDHSSTGSLRHMEDSTPEAVLQLVEQLTQRLAGVERERDQLRYALAQQRQEGGRELARLRQENLNLVKENTELRARMTEGDRKSPTHLETKLEPDIVVLGEEEEREEK